MQDKSRIQRLWIKRVSQPAITRMTACMSVPLLLTCLSVTLPQSVCATGSTKSAITQKVNQERTITGIVKDASGEPIIGATIALKGTSRGTISDVDGKFALEAKPGDILLVSYVGYTPKQVSVGETKNYIITLASASLNLDEVVVTAFGIKKERKALGYAVQDLKSDELLKNKTSNVLNALNGKVAGVNVTQSGGSAGAGAQIVLRGGTSLERDNQPLFVVDGVIYDNGTPIGGNSGFDGAQRISTSYSNRVMDINPEDIESMSVLKGPAAAALYGSRAAAGVIVITTKKGNSDGTTQVMLSSKFSSNWVNKYPEQQSSYKRGQYNERDLFIDEWVTDSWGDKFAEGETVYNNIKDFFRTGHSWDNTATVSGGNQNGTFYLSLSRFDQTGIVPETGFHKTTARFNGDRTYGRLTVAANVAYSVSNTDKTLTSAGLWGAGNNGAMNAVYNWARSENMRTFLNEDGSKYRIFQSYDPDNLLLENDLENPYWIVNKNKINDQTNRFTGSVAPRFKITDWLELNYRLGYDNYLTTDYTYIAPGAAISDRYQNGRISENDINYEYIISNVMIQAQKTFGAFDLNLLLGQSAEQTTYSRNRRMGYDFITPDFPSFENINDANKFLQTNYSRKRLVGIYGEFRAAYKSIAYLTFTGRNDWTSTLPSNNNSYFYPSVGGSFIFTELIPENQAVTFGKVRASWARVGKDTDPYVTTTALWAPRTFLAGTGTGNSWDRGNPYLKPEKTESTELGLEMRFLNGRVGFDYTYYTNNSMDQIVSPRLSQTNGYIMYKVNIGNVYNKGMELSITGTPIKTRNFTWDASLNMAGNRGTVKNLLDGMEMLYVTDVQVGGVKAASINNGDFMAIVGNVWKRDDAGNVILDATTGMPTYTTNSATYIGNREPKFTGGFNNNLQWKNWNLSILFDFRKGGVIYNGTEYAMTASGMSKLSENRESITIKGVIPDGKDAAGNVIYKPAEYTFNANEQYNILNADGSVKQYRSGRQIIREYYSNIYDKESVHYTTNTNWFRLRSVSLSYDLPKELMKKTKFIKDCRLTATGTNLLLWTNYKGMDPESSVAGSGITGSSSTGIDYCGVPSTASFSFGINLIF